MHQNTDFKSCNIQMAMGPRITIAITTHSQQARIVQRMVVPKRSWYDSAVVTMALPCHLHSSYSFNWNKALPKPLGGVGTEMTILKWRRVSWWKVKLLFHLQLLVFTQVISVNLVSSFFWNITIHHLVFVTQQLETIRWIHLRRSDIQWTFIIILGLLDRASSW